MTLEGDTNFLHIWILKKRQEGILDTAILDLIENNTEGDRINEDGFVAGFLRLIGGTGQNGENKKDND